MANIIAVIWDCDKTLIDGYMQKPLFDKYGVDEKEFWKQVNAYHKQYKDIRVNKDTGYLNQFIKEAHGGRFDGLNRDILIEAGKDLTFYPGIPEIFKKTKELFKGNKAYSEYGIQVEHYIVSTGFADTIRGSELMPYVEDIWGCELGEEAVEGDKKVISEILYTIDNTTKTRALFEINKGIGKVEDIEVNTRLEKSLRRVQFENMIYIADGPSDIPAFSLINQSGGSTFAVYPKGDIEAMKQVEQMRMDGRVQMYAEADYSENTTANMWITNKIKEIAERIRDGERNKIRSTITPVPKHLT